MSNIILPEYSLVDQLKYKLELLTHDVKAGRPVVDVLPLLFQLKGRPYGLGWSHFMFEPMFKVKNMPRKMLWKTGRQIGKTVSQSASQILRCMLNKHYTILTVLPQFEQARVFSSNNVSPLINQSPFRKLILNQAKSDAVLQRDIGDGSKIYFGYTHGGADRLRGRATDEVNYDEIQSIDLEVMPVVDACMSASRFKISRYTGTPLTFDNTIQLYWDDSSKAEWVIKCDCGYSNMCTVEADLLNMLGDNTLVCAKCKRQANSRLGYWHHSVPERQLVFPGYHVPQVILPMHYESPKDWAVIKDIQRTKPKYAFYNEVLGESFDSGSKMLTQDELRSACIIKRQDPQEFQHGRYIAVTCGVDWGGRGKEKTTDTDDFISNTALAVAGLTPEGVIEIPYLFRVPYELNHFSETRLVAQTAGIVRANWLAMDAGGQGNVLEEMVKSTGWPVERICPFTYAVMPRQRPLVHYKPPKAFGVRSSYTLDKPRSLMLLCELIKAKQIVFADEPNWVQNHLQDFMAIYLESIDDPRGSPRRLVKRMARRTDDIVHAINFAVMSLYHSTSRWPSLANAFIDMTATDLIDPDDH